MNDELVKYYEDNQDDIDLAWSVYLMEHDFGLGEDRIKPNDAMFWEFVEEYRDEG